jgi:hypothetical protein
MIELNLDRCVGAAADHVAKIIPSLLQYSPIDQFMAVLRISRGNELFEIVKSCVEIQKTRNSLSGLWISVCGTGNAINLNDLHIVLVLRKLQGIQPSQYIDDLCSLEKDVDSSGIYYFAAWGAKIDSKIVLTDTLKLVPWSEVPECRQKIDLSPSTHVGIREDVWYEPNFALEVAIPRMVEVYRRHGGVNFPKLETAANAFKIVADTLRVMMLSGETPMWLIGAWPLPNSQKIRAMSGGSSLSTFQSSPFISRIAVDPSPLDVQILQDLLKKWSAASEETREALRVSIDRGCSAALSVDESAAALDQGISFETILMHGQNNNTSEITYRISVRAAKLIGGSPEYQYRVFKLVKGLYRLRSKIAHGGKHDFSQAERNDLDDGRKLYVQVVRKILEVGRFPEWERDVVFTN